MGIDPAASVTNSDGRIHLTTNVHVAGPSIGLYWCATRTPPDFILKLENVTEEVCAEK